MENNEKYYIPNLQEFHIGFEYEWMREGDTSWTRTKMMENTSPICDVDAQRMNKYRVKYLDRWGIEDLGFSLEDEKNLINIYVIGDEHQGLYTLIHYKPTRLVGIYNNAGNKHEAHFTGIIKNKTELKILLNQLRIPFKNNKHD